METGQRKNNKTGELIPPHYIQEVVATANGEKVITIYWGPAVSKNPYLSFMFKNSKVGDKIEITWFDTKDNNDSLETVIQ